MSKAHFEPNPVIVKINKFKPYRFYSDNQLVIVSPKQLPRGLTTDSTTPPADVDAPGEVPLFHHITAQGSHGASYCGSLPTSAMVASTPIVTTVCEPPLRTLSTRITTLDTSSTGAD